MSAEFILINADDLKSKKINEIKQILTETSITEINNILELLKYDKRVGVKSLVKQYEKKIQEHEKELNRLNIISEYENKYINQGYNLIAGIDEVGRGPLAGPVIASAVILPQNCLIEYIDDSKKLSPNMREALFAEIEQKALDISLGIVDNKKIDEINILQATLSAMTIAVNGLKNTPDVCLIDALRLPQIKIKQESILKGDEKSISIAAASVYAKVVRDRLMVSYHDIYPQYNFSKNKGYGTSEHIDAIKKYGPCPIHRLSFIQKFL